MKSVITFLTIFLLGTFFISNNSVLAVATCVCEDPAASSTVVAAAGIGDEASCFSVTSTQGVPVANCQWIGGAVSSTPSTFESPANVPLINPLTGTASAQDIPTFVGGIIQRLLGILGSISLVVFMYGAFKWITSEGESDDIEEGTHTMAYAAIGILVIFASYGILQSVIGGITGG